MLRNGEVRTAFLSVRVLREGTAMTIPAAYKQTMLNNGLPVENWVAHMFLGH